MPHQQDLALADGPEGFRHLPGHLDRPAQEALLAEVLAAVAGSGWFRPVMPRSGRPLSVRMGNLGPLGWVADRRGYRYQRTHPDSGRPWPPLPAALLALWDAVTGWPAPPEACLVNLYQGTARMGLHQDRDEADLTQPVVSISLGDAALFRIGGTERGEPTQSVWLGSGDVAVLEGAGRLAYHGIDRIRPGSSTLLPQGGRINLTLRVAGPIASPPS
jgi:alkylated DNA repair protein (DNA oxidative demethylase)